MRNTKKNLLAYKKYFPVILLMIFFVMQVPFLNADADYFLSTSRGPWTDEGLYTFQLRNFFNQHGFSLNEGDGLLKAPLYNLMLFPVMYVFGNNIVAIRLFLVIVIVVSFYVFVKQQVFQKATLIFLSITLFQFHVFQYAHTALCEISAISVFMAGVGLFIRSQIVQSKKLFIVSLCVICFSAFIKIIFLYFLILVPLTLFIENIFSYQKDKKNNVKDLILPLGIGFIFIAVYFIFWRILDYDYFLKVITGQTEVTYGSSIKSIWERVKMNQTFYFNDTYFTINIVIFYINILVSGLVFFFRKKINFTKHRTLFILTACWLIFELLRFGNAYLPSRYLLSGIIANMLYLSICIDLLFTLLIKYFKFIIYALCSCVFVLNIIQYTKSFNRRTYVMNEINDYLSATNFNNQPVLGNWAASCTWKNGAYVKPLAHGYNEINTFENYHPRAIITETDEADTEKVLQEQGINISEHSDSSRTFKINQWTLVVYWIKQ